MRFGITVLRTTIGFLFMGHGFQKLRGWFGGGGPEGTAAAFDKAGLKPAKAHAIVAGTSETTAGALLVAGALTPLATSMVTGTMVTAIRRVSGQNGIWITKGGAEYNAVLIAAAFAIAAEGPGAFSLDEALGIERSGTAIAFAQLGLGLAGAAVVEVAARASELAEQRNEISPSAGDHTPFPEMGPAIDLREAAEVAPPMVGEGVPARP